LRGNVRISKARTINLSKHQKGKTTTKRKGKRRKKKLRSLNPEQKTKKQTVQSCTWEGGRENDRGRVQPGGARSQQGAKGNPSSKCRGNQPRAVLLCRTTTAVVQRYGENPIYASESKSRPVAGKTGNAQAGMLCPSYFLGARKPMTDSVLSKTRQSSKERSWI